jgi:uncharacterized protein with GYD domain
MPKYLITASYTQEGVKGLLKDGGTRRREVVENLAKGLGGSIEAFYYAFGGDDLIVIIDMPDEATAAAVSLTVAASGSASLKTTVLITPETIDEATKKSVNYIPPGR